MADPIAINSLILTQLAEGEMGLLRLIVAVRKSLGRFEKGDLSEIVKSALRKLVLSQAVVEVDGIYSLGPSRMGHRPSRGAAGVGTE